MNIKHLIPLPVVALAALFCTSTPGLAQSVLLTAGDFALLGGTAITSTGVTGTNIIAGNVGLSPGATSGITGFPPAVITGGGAIVATGAVTAQARLDLITASVALANMPSSVNMSNVDLGGKTLTPGVYTFNGAAALNGALTLDAQGKNNVAWVFQIGTALTSSINSTVTFANLGTNGGSDLGVFWNAGSSITIGANNQIAGNYLAGTSITLGGVSSGGARALALAGISLDNNTVNAKGGPAGGDLAGGLAYNSSGAIVPGTSAVTGGLVVPGGVVTPGGSVVVFGTVVPGATIGSSGSVVLGSTGAYVAGAAGAVLTPGTPVYTTLLSIDGNMANGTVPTSLRVSGATATLTGTNTYTGGTYVDSGAVVTGSANLPSNQPVSLTNSSSLIFNQPADGSFGGAISGSGSVTKLGSGALTITGANTYTGGTSVNAGSLIGNTTTLPGGQSVAVATGSTLVFNQAAQGNFSGQITGGGLVQKRGAGALTLTKLTSTSVEVQAGALYFNSGMGTTTVDAGAFLGGNGTINGNLINNGTVSPGYSPGRINVTGNYTQSSTGTLVIQLASGASFDQLVVTGSATLAGTLQVDVLNNFNPIGQSFTFLTAAGGVNGRFGSLKGTATVTNDITLVAAVVYAPNSATLTFQQVPFASFALTPNQIATANAAQLNPTLTAALKVVQSPGQFPAALNALSPQDYQIWSDFAFANATALSDHLLQSGRMPTGCDDYYFEGGQRRGRSRGDLDLGPSTYTASNGLIGGNRSLNANTTVGAFFGFGTTTAGLGSGGISQTRVKNNTLGVRAAVTHGALWAEAMLAYGMDTYNSTRTVNFAGTNAVAKSYTRGNQWTTGATVGADLKAGSLTVSPFVGLLASRWKANSFTETGAGEFGATLGNQRDDSLRSQLGVEGRYTLGIIQPHARAAWLDEFSNGSRSMPASFGAGNNFALMTRRSPRNTMLYSVGVDVLLARHALLYTDFTTQGGGDTKVLDEWRVGLSVSF